MFYASISERKLDEPSTYKKRCASMRVLILPSSGMFIIAHQNSYVSSVYSKPCAKLQVCAGGFFKKEENNL